MMTLLVFTNTKNKFPVLADAMPDLKDYLTTEEAAKKLGFHVKSIPNMVKSGAIESVKVGKFLLISKKSVDNYLKKTKGMSKNDPRRSS